MTGRAPIGLCVAVAAVCALACGSPPKARPQAPPVATKPRSRGAQVRPLPVVKSSKDPQLRKLYECWFDEPYEYMFSGPFREEDDDSFGRQDSATGTYIAGTRGILEYGGLVRCMAKLVKEAVKSRRSYAAIEALAKLKVYAGGSSWRKKFPAYNRMIIRWGHENLLPHPDLIIAGKSARLRYHAQFERFFRLMADAYLFLLRSRRYPAYQQRYRASVEKGVDGMDYLEVMFEEHLRKYSLPKDWYSALTPQQAVGFWLRRGIDGTHDEIWRGLRKVLILYDAGFYRELTQRFSNVPSVWSK